MPRTTDEAEPTANRSVVPIWLIILLTLLAYWGMLYLNTHGGGFSSKVYAPYGSFALVDDAQPHVIGPNPKQGLKIFTANCAVCHQATGFGVPGQFPPLAGSEWVQAAAANRLERILLSGLQGPVEVKQQQFGAVQMPPWRDLLKDEDIAAVLTFVRGNKDWGNSAGPVTVEQVKAIRAKIATHPDPFTAEELQKLSDDE
ncbi:MAG: cytochrome c class [Pedosphaera sp.]|nr:cytochrome c class [Pedosphaera sp.]